MDVKKIKELVKDLIIALAVVIIVFVALFAYSGVWPPIVVVESGSMQHGNQFVLGVINTGDIVLVKKVNSISNIITYVQAREIGYKDYGDYGNVIIYQSPYYSTPIIHRAIMYVTWQGSVPVIEGESKASSFLSVYGDYVVIRDMGYSHRNLIVDLSSFVGESGFVTMGDHNLALAPPSSNQIIYPQLVYTAADLNVGITNAPVTLSNIEGIAQGYLPWFGDLKLLAMGEGSAIPSNSLAFCILSVIAIILAPVAIDYALDYYKKIKQETKTESDK